MKFRFAFVLLCSIACAIATLSSAKAAVFEFNFSGPVTSAGSSFTGGTLSGFPYQFAQGAIGASGSLSYETQQSPLSSTPEAGGTRSVYALDGAAINVPSAFPMSLSSNFSSGPRVTAAIRVYNDVQASGIATPNTLMAVISPASDRIEFELQTITSLSNDRNIYERLFVVLFDGSGSAFASGAIPQSISLSNFDHMRFDYSISQEYLGLPSGSSYIAGDIIRPEVSPVPVPLGPSTWPTMILGLVGLGFMACRRQRKPASSA